MWIEVDDILYMPKLIKTFNYPGCPSPYVVISGDDWSAEIRNPNLTITEIKEYIVDTIIKRIPILYFSKDEGWDVKIVRVNEE
jgi:hypothetical protein